MTLLFCCDAVYPYRPGPLINDGKFKNFLQWAQFPRESEPESSEDASDRRLQQLNFPLVIQLVKQVNYGSLEIIRYFAATEGATADLFIEVVQQDLITANYKKLNAYKNFKCDTHNKFFEVNIYEKDPHNQHHWRHNVARPASEIDLNAGIAK